MSSRRDTIRRIVEALDNLYPRHEAEAIARAALTDKEGISLSHLLAFADEECLISDAEIGQMVGELASGRPLQFVLGHCGFCGLDFEVGEGVLIPRPETEILVEAVIERASDSAAILDLCTGSGCIAIALAKRLKKCKVMATDISADALEYARRNAGNNGVAVEFVHADIFKWCDDDSSKFDIIVSNPPYVPLSDKESMHINVVGFEPHEALFVPDEDPLLFYKRIAEFGRQAINEEGWLCFEIYEHFADQTRAMLAEKGYKSIVVLEDANLKPRVVCCQR